MGLLARQREAVTIAAAVVRDWAAGYIAYEDAVATVNEAMAIVGQEQPEEGEEDAHWPPGH